MGSILAVLMALFPLQRAPLYVPVRSSPSIAQSSNLLHEEDFTYAGAFKTPGGFPNPATGPYTTAFSFAAPVTFRRTAGTDRLISTGYSGSNTYPVYEMDIPALTMGGTVASFNTASIYNNWDMGPYFDGATYLIPDAGINTIVYGLFWDSVDSRLYWACGPYYTGVELWPTLGYCTLNDGTGVASGIGIWQYDNVNHKHVKGGLLRIPDAAFVDEVCAGKPLCGGFGTPGYSIITGHSIGPAFYAIAPIDVGTYPSGSAIPNKELLSYPWNTSYTPSIPYRVKRNIGYASRMFLEVISATSNSVTVTDVHSFNSGDDFTGVPIYVKSGTGAGQTVTGTGAASGWTIPTTLFSPPPDATSMISFAVDWTWPVTGGIGYQVNNDVSYGASVWVKTASGKQAIVMFMNLIMGDTYYGHNGNEPRFESGRHEIWLIDPAELRAVGLGLKTNYTVEPYETFEIQLPWVTYPLGINDISTSYGHQYMGGATLTPEHDRIYASFEGGWWDGSALHPIVFAMDIAP